MTATDLTMESVARRCGCGNAESLCQAFVATYGVTPSHFRSTQTRALESATPTTTLPPRSVHQARGSGGSVGRTAARCCELRWIQRWMPSDVRPWASPLQGPRRAGLG